MPEAFIVSIVRTPVGRFMGSLKTIPSPRLGALVVSEALSRSGVDPARVEEVIMGCVLPAGLGQNPARQAAIWGGVPDTAAAMTINKVCGSGLKAVALAAQAIRAGDADVVVAGGFENMSRAPYLLPQARAGLRLGHGELVDSMVKDGLWDVYNDFHMGITAEKVAEKYGFTRQDQDAYAAESHRKAAKARGSGAFDGEIVPVEVPQRKGDPLLFARDECIRDDTNVETLSHLRPAFKKDGTVTAGNAPGVNDAASAAVVVSEKVVAELGLQPLVRVVGYATGGVAPEWVMMAPVESTRKLNAKLGLTNDHYDLFELNEAFSVQALAVTKELEIDPSKVNVNGGAVAIGHPIGASGARILTTLIHEMKASGKKTGLAALCLGGGNGISMAVESC